MKRALIAVLGTCLISGTVLAGDDDPPEPCFASVGCLYDRTLSAGELNSQSCDELWTIRNGLFASRGYCFKTARGREAFGNASCRYDDEAAVPLNDYERANIRFIRAIEKRRGC